VCMFQWSSRFTRTAGSCIALRTLFRWIRYIRALREEVHYWKCLILFTCAYTVFTHTRCTYKLIVPPRGPYIIIRHTVNYYMRCSRLVRTCVAGRVVILLYFPYITFPRRNVVNFSSSSSQQPVRYTYTDSYTNHEIITITRPRVCCC